MMNGLRGGMQVHAVPESERAYDSTGRKLPWAYEFADADISRRRELEEKGPFGRSTRRRGFSRSKTATPARKEDAVRLENMAVEDTIFNKFKEEQRTRETQQQKAPSTTIDASATTNQSQQTEKEPTEVIIYGYGTDQDWAAIDFYERISNGCIYEDYDRHPPHTKYDVSLSYGRATAQRSLSQAALRKRNTYRGGNHWIKVTFDSPEAADQACYRSPHPIHGHLVYAEPYRGTGPAEDISIPHTNAGAQLDNTALPRSFSTNTFSQVRTQEASPNGSSTTMSSATALGAPVPQPAGLPRSSTTPSLSSADPFSRTTALDRPQQSQQLQQRPMRIAGAKRAMLLPAEQAFMPAPSRYNNLLASLPLVGFLIGGKSDVIGSQVPRLEDGSFDWEKASLYWRFFAWLDSLLGTDFCGLNGED
ncbi:hypothetical protein M8818_003488 [Zalaria obscura]|uniref:Uncharacterized protein n=1 Tax=Zalaria obscura TaxID=2024903 RepID=A0ACC3SED7_9PEZI